MFANNIPNIEQVINKHH